MSRRAYCDGPLHSEVGGGFAAMHKVQDLARFQLPPDFRGRSAVVVQLWWIVRDTLFLCSPQFMYGWRNALLRLFGAKIGKGVMLRPTVRITYPWKLKIGDNVWCGDFVELYTLGEIEIGADVVVSQNSYICAASHDHTVPTFDIYTKRVIIEPEVWVAADVFVGPGVRIGRGAVIGARSTLLSDAPEMMIMAGSPAKVVRPRAG